MKTVGIIGGMSYQSTLHYYQRINEQVNEKLGGLASAKLLIYNVDFEEIRKLMIEEKWQSIGNILLEISRKLEQFGVYYIAIATNTIHKVASFLEENISIPLIHISDCVAKKCIENNIKKVGVLGTRYTMTEEFVIDRLRRNGLETFTPNDISDILTIDNIIFYELCKGVIKNSSKKIYINIINNMIKKYGIEGIIFGCTEIEMLISEKELSIPVFDTTKEHINTIVEHIVEKR